MTADKSLRANYPAKCALVSYLQLQRNPKAKKPSGVSLIRIADCLLNLRKHKALNSFRYSKIPLLLLSNTVIFWIFPQNCSIQFVIIR